MNLGALGSLVGIRASIVTWLLGREVPNFSLLCDLLRHLMPWIVRRRFAMPNLRPELHFGVCLRGFKDYRHFQEKIGGTPLQDFAKEL